jgi:hypothetical protein
MLGRLAKWLRLLGYDTAYMKDVDDEALLAVAEESNRILLTRDTLLIRRKRCRNYIFIRSNHWREQLTQVYVEAGLSTESALSLCPLCNQPLVREEKESVRTIVPPYVYKTQTLFSRCGSCMRVYWTATHVRRILDELKGLQKGRLS